MRRGWLRAFYRTLAETGLSLSNGLYAALDTPYATVVSGRLILGTSANGQSVTFAGPGQGSLQPNEVLALISWLIDRYDEAVVALGSGTDAEILAQMLAYIKPIKSYRYRYTTLRSANDV